MNSLPSMITWTCKKEARSEPAEMGVPFAFFDHSEISRSNKNTNPCSFICSFFFHLYLFSARFLTELGMTFFFQFVVTIVHC